MDAREKVVEEDVHRRHSNVCLYASSTRIQSLPSDNHDSYGFQFRVAFLAVVLP